MKQSSNIRSVERAFAVLRALRPNGRAVSLATIADDTGLPKSTASRLLSTMVGIGVVEKVSEAGYVVGRELRAIAHPGVGPSDLIGISATYLRDLVHEVGEDAGLAIPDRDHVMYIDQVQKSRPVQVQDWTGERFENHTTAAGYVFLASWDDEDLDTYLARPLAKSSPTTETDPVRLREYIDMASSNGYAWTFEAWLEGVNGAAAPIADAAGEVVASINLYGPAYRFPGDIDPDAIGKRLVETATQISRHLGAA